MPDSSAFLMPATGVIRHKVLIRMRWFAVAGQLAALALGTWLFGLQIDLLAPGLIILASALFNLCAMLVSRSEPYLHNRGATLSLAFDSVQLALLLHVTGGLSNPFAVLMLAPMVAGATLLAGRSVVLLTAFGLVALTLLLALSPPLNWPDRRYLPPLFFVGAYVALVVTMLFLVLYVRRLARESRRLGEALGASRLALAREQKISAFGALAAAVAHELGSPLSTITMIARDLRKEAVPEGMREDIDLLNQQVDRCRSILADFSRHGMVEEKTFARMPLTRWLQHIAEPYLRDGIAFDVVVVRGEGPEPMWPMQPALMHGVANPLQNAFSFAREQVRVEASWQDAHVVLRILDDGPGFPPHLLAELGAHTLARQREEGGHMGLGLFIAKALLQRSGANVDFTNKTYSDGTITGACVTLEWRVPPV